MTRTRISLDQLPATRPAEPGPSPEAVAAAEALVDAFATAPRAVLRRLVYPRYAEDPAYGQARFQTMTRRDDPTAGVERRLSARAVAVWRERRAWVQQAVPADDPYRNGPLWLVQHALLVLLLGERLDDGTRAVLLAPVRPLLSEEG